MKRRLSSIFVVAILFSGFAAPGIAGAELPASGRPTTIDDAARFRSEHGLSMTRP